MRCVAVLLLVALLQVEGALPVEDDYQRALRDDARRTECGECPHCPPQPANCTFLVSSGENHFYDVDGIKLKIELSPWRLKMICPPGVTLDSASLPVFPTQLRVLSIELIACPAPRAAGGVSHVLSRLNITRDLDALYLDDMPPATRLEPDVFSGLQHLHWLFLSAEAGLVLESPPGLLEPLVKLQSLSAKDVRMSSATLARLPPNLEWCNLVQRPLAEGSVPVPRSTDLENVTLTEARSSVSALRSLTVTSPRGTAALPAGWLLVRDEARCPRLRELWLNSCALRDQPPDALRGLTELRTLKVMDCPELRELPHELFNDTRSLRQLFLDNNALEVLPESIFAPLRELEFLSLSGNRLGVLGDSAAALGGVRSLTLLRVLMLDHNPLGDTCGHSSRDAILTISELSPLTTELSPLTTDLSPLSTVRPQLTTELSPFHELRALRQLSLAHTGASRLCADWRHNLTALYRIDFSYNNLTALKYSDVQWYGRDPRVDRVELRLAGARLASLPDALPASLRVLDLRDAWLGAGGATERQAAALFADGRDVLLDGAHVGCTCAGGARPALALALAGRAADVRCAEDGRRVREAAPCPAAAAPGPRGAWAGALVLAALVLAAAWCAALRGSRLRVKAFLLARGMCASWTHRDDDDDSPYDVFIWFSRHDFEVVSQIVRELEKGPRPLRVCVHYRDWRAGESILAQIQRSVISSRRTLVLVSGHAARSVWARAVLREAAARALRDVTPRLVVALLQAAPPPLDPELAHYVRANTYARWGDRAFWDRLRLALPVPRPTAAVLPVPA